MNVRVFFLPLLLGLGVLTACEAPGDEVLADERGAFVTLLGDDTLAVERFARTANGMTADVVLRTPATRRYRYDLQLTDDGALDRYEAVAFAPQAGDAAAPLARAVYTSVGDSLRVEMTDDRGETTTHVLAASGEALPFVDMVHWPFELVLERLYLSREDSLTQPLFTERGAMPFVVRDLGDGRMTIQHPFRGTMEVEVDEEGRLVRLDAGQTTRKLTVERVPEVDVDATAARFAALDAGGQSFGPLSGRGEAVGQVDGATIGVDYGQPLKRGRDIWGALVPYGEVWRTGANRATHFTTDRPLRMGTLDVPAGEYTLFSIPEAEGGVLVVNRQTGQGGTSYDPEQDLGRVPMERRALDAPVEAFTIEVEDTPAGGELQLRWDRSAFVVPFTVR